MDIDMLSYAGIWAAIRNALDEVKAAAVFITLNNDENGIAEWLIKNVL